MATTVSHYTHNHQSAGCQILWVTRSGPNVVMWSMIKPHLGCGCSSRRNGKLCLPSWSLIQPSWARGDYGQYSTQSQQITLRGYLAVSLKREDCVVAAPLESSACRQGSTFSQAWRWFYNLAGKCSSRARSAVRATDVNTAHEGCTCRLDTGPKAGYCRTDGRVWAPL